jgi:hypothetical protein
MWNSILSVVVTLMLHSAILAQQPAGATGCDPAAYVNNQIITRSEFAAALQDYRAELGRQLDGQHCTQSDVDLQTEHHKQDLLEEMIENLVLEQEAHRLGLESDDGYQRLVDDPCSGLGAACDGTDNVASFERTSGNRGWMSITSALRTRPHCLGCT